MKDMKESCESEELGISCSAEYSGDDVRSKEKQEKGCGTNSC